MTGVKGRVSQLIAGHHPEASVSLGGLEPGVLFSSWVFYLNMDN